MTEPVLSLDTLIVRPTIEIDGTRYEILSPDELSVIDSRRFGLWVEQLEALQNRSTPSELSEEAIGAELEQLVDQIARKAAVGVPPEVFAKLSGQDKIALVEVFTVLLLRRRMSAAGAIGTAMEALTGGRPTGATSFPGFSGSMGERRGSGWRRRLWRWFARTPG